jgi:hypothetical protein
LPKFSGSIKLPVSFLCRRDSYLYESVEHFEESNQEAKSSAFVENPSNKL